MIFFIETFHHVCKGALYNMMYEVLKQKTLESKITFIKSSGERDGRRGC